MSDTTPRLDPSCTAHLVGFTGDPAGEFYDAVATASTNLECDASPAGDYVFGQLVRHRFDGVESRLDSLEDGLERIDRLEQNLDRLRSSIEARQRGSAGSTDAN